MATINYTDTLFATISQRGNILATLRLVGMSSFADIVREIRSSTGTAAGLINLSLRNSTQGWSRNSALLF